MSWRSERQAERSERIAINTLLIAGPLIGLLWIGLPAAASAFSKETRVFHQVKTPEQASVAPSPTPSSLHSDPVSISLLKCARAGIRGFADPDQGANVRMGPGNKFEIVDTITASKSQPINDVVKVTQRDTVEYWAEYFDGIAGDLPTAAYVQLAVPLSDRAGALIPNKSLDECEPAPSK
jgi:hypothetical protein